MGQSQPPKGSVSAEAQSLAAANEAGTSSKYASAAGGGGGGAAAQIDPATQSQLDREANFVETADKIQNKLATEPESVTQEDAHAMHSREVKAFGGAEKGGIAAQAQSRASKNE